MEKNTRKKLVMVYNSAMFHSRKNSSFRRIFSPIFTTGGLVLTETLIALATLTTAVIAMGTITTSSISTTILLRDNLVADGLLNEAVEIVKNLPNTNQLRKPGQKKCWLMLDTNCNVFPQLSNYILVLKNGIPELQFADVGELNLDAGLSANADKYQLYLENGMYTGSIEAKSANLKSKFFRSVKFTAVSGDSATFEAKVQWKDGAKTREINEMVTLYNYI